MFNVLNICRVALHALACCNTQLARIGDKFGGFFLFEFSSRALFIRRFLLNHFAFIICLLNIWREIESEAGVVWRHSVKCVYMTRSGKSTHFVFNSNNQFSWNIKQGIHIGKNKLERQFIDCRISRSLIKKKMCNVSQYAVFVFRARMQLTSFTLVWENIEHRLKIDIYRFKKNNTVRAKPKLWITVKQCYPGSKYGVLEKIKIYHRLQYALKCGKWKLAKAAEKM